MKIDDTPLSSSQQNELNDDTDSKNVNCELGEHIVAFWIENESIKWYLGIVEGHKKN